MRRLLILAAIAACLSSVHGMAAQGTDAGYDRSSAAKLELSGWLDTSLGYRWGRDGSALYDYLHKEDDDPGLHALGFADDLFVNGDFSNSGMRLSIKAYASYADPRNIAYGLSELYGDASLGDFIRIQAGKASYSWGKGYGFSTVDYLGAPRPRDAPEASKEGRISAMVEFTKSLDSPILQILTLSAIACPPAKGSASEEWTWNAEDTEFAGKLYALFGTIDLELMGYYRGEDSFSAGSTISFSLLPEVEAHGEYSYNHEVDRRYPERSAGLKGGLLQGETVDASSYLAGIRLAPSARLAIVMEYYHNALGLSVEEYGIYRDTLVGAAENTDPSAATRAGSMREAFRAPVLLRDYFYARVSINDPLDLIGLSIASSLNIGLGDKSASIGLQAAYSPITDVAFYLNANAPIGASGTEYGDGAAKASADIGMKLYF